MPGEPWVAVADGMRTRDRELGCRVLQRTRNGTYACPRVRVSWHLRGSRNGVGGRIPSIRLGDRRIWHRVSGATDPQRYARRVAIGDGSDSDGRRRHLIAQDVVSTLLVDQLSRSDSLNSASGALAGLAGVVTTLAGIVPKLTSQSVGLAGISAAGLSAVLAVIALTTRRPGREPVDIDSLVKRILDTEDVSLTLEVLLIADAVAAKRNDQRLRVKGALVTLAASALALAVILIVATMMVVGS